MHGDGRGDGEPDAPAWFAYGRALLVVAATVAESTDGAVPPGDADAAATAVDLDRARTALLTSLDDDEAFSVLVANARLSSHEAEVLALLAAAEVDLHCRRLAAAISGTSNGGRLTLGTLAVLLPAGHPGALTVRHGAPLRRAAFVEVLGDSSWADRTIALHEAVVWSLLGDSSPDPDLPAGLATLELDEPSDRAIDALATVGLGQHQLVLVTGSDRMRRRELGAWAGAADRYFCVQEPTTDANWSAMIREATITGRGLVVEIGDSLDDTTRRWLDRATHLIWVLSSRSGPPVDQLPERPWTAFDAPADEPSDLEWAAAFGDATARTHRLTYDQLHRVQRIRSAVGGDLDTAVRRLASGPLEQLTRRISPTRTWDDIVLSPDRKALLQSVVDRYRHANVVYDTWGFAATPSRGLVALFSGPSGTGKTLASEIIAGALGLDVFKLDLSSVVSKYIGETEKNLEQIFDAASAGNMVLFFDEADSLFGKRSEVKDARDRYANIEVSYLLQRLEAYDGLVILATNFEKNVDEAFLRRIHVRVEFAMPGVEERRAIWEANLPTDAPVGDVDVDWLAHRFELSGAAIRNAAIHAAFSAAAAGTSITMESAVLGVAREFRKLGRLLKDRDFDPYFDLVSD
jgi:YD repeat-containing protein